MNRTDLAHQAKAATRLVLRDKGFVSPLEVMRTMGRLSKANYERWCARLVPHLEIVLPGNLNEHEFLCQQVRAYAREVLKLKPSRATYTILRKGRRVPLRFTRSGDPHLEELFATHYIKPEPSEIPEAPATGTLSPETTRPSKPT